MDQQPLKHSLVQENQIIHRSGGPLQSIQANQLSVCMTPSESVALLTVDPHFPSSWFKPTPFSRSKFSLESRGVEWPPQQNCPFGRNIRQLPPPCKGEQTPAPIFWSKLVPTPGRGLNGRWIELVSNSAHLVGTCTCKHPDTGQSRNKSTHRPVSDLEI